MQAVCPSASVIALGSARIIAIDLMEDEAFEIDEKTPVRSNVTRASRVTRM